MPIDDDFGFSLPAAIRDFVFDLHEATRRSCRIEDVNRLYETKYREITDKYFPKSAWPGSSSIASEVGNDELFLILYSEMTMRHVTTRLKPQLNDHLSSWANYKKLFNLVVNTNDDSLMLSSQWIYDIMQEFAYQFQGFCQFRWQTNHNADVLETLNSNRDAWNLQDTFAILNNLIRTAKAKSSNPRSGVVSQFGYFASIELARLQCLLGDFEASLTILSQIKLNDRNELFMKLPICHFNTYYHVGVSQMMLGRYTEAIDTFSDIILYVLGILKPGAGNALRSGAQPQLTRMNEKAMSLTAILITVLPAYRIEEAVKSAIDAKFDEKMKKLANGEASSAVELFENACPKFISAEIPDFKAGNKAAQNEHFDKHVRSLTGDIMLLVPFLKLRSLLEMYTSIDIAKLARFNNMNENELIQILTQYKEKTSKFRNVNKGIQKSIYSDINYEIRGNILQIEAPPKKQESNLSVERFFAAQIRKNREIVAHLNKTFTKEGF